MRVDWTGGLESEEPIWRRFAAVAEEVMVAWTRAETVVGRAKRRVCDELRKQDGQDLKPRYEEALVYRDVSYPGQPTP